MTYFTDGPEVECLYFDNALSEIISTRCVSLHHNFLSHFLLQSMHFKIIVFDWHTTT